MSIMGNLQDGLHMERRQRAGPRELRICNNNNYDGRRRCADFIPRRKYYRSHPYAYHHDPCGFQQLQTFIGDGTSRSCPGFRHDDYSLPDNNFCPHFYPKDDSFKANIPKAREQQEELISPGGEEITSPPTLDDELPSSSTISSSSVILVDKGGDPIIEWPNHQQQLVENIFVLPHHNDTLLTLDTQILDDQIYDQQSPTITTVPPSKLSTTRLFSNFPEIHQKCPGFDFTIQQQPAVSESQVEFVPENIFLNDHNFGSSVPSSRFDLRGSPSPEPPEEVQQLDFLLSEPIYLSSNSNIFVDNGGGGGGAAAAAAAVVELGTNVSCTADLDVSMECSNFDYFSHIPPATCWTWLIVGGLVVTTVCLIGRHREQILARISVVSGGIVGKVRSCGCPVDAPHNFKCKLRLMP